MSYLNHWQTKSSESNQLQSHCSISKSDKRTETRDAANETFTDVDPVF